MNVEHFLIHFDLLGDEPEIIQQFRKLVVALAISEKLVVPGADHHQPTKLRELIEARKSKLIQQGQLRKQDTLAELTSNELPKGFETIGTFVRLGAVARIEKGLTGISKAKPGPYPLVVTAEERASCDHFDFDGAAAIVPLVSSAGHGKASLQRLHYQKGKFALGSILAAIFPHAPELISARFLFEYLTAFKEELLVSRMIGTANVSLSIGKISDVPVPLVSPSIQRRVDELMALCDRLEAARTMREALRDRLTAGSFARLNTPDPETFTDDARFALDALPALTKRPEQIEQLRQTILNLAVRGKLVPQEPKDEPASELLKKIAEEKARLINAGEVKREKPIEAFHDQTKPFEVPSNWEWVRLDTLSRLITKGSSPKWQGVDYVSANEGILFITSENVGNYELRKLDELKYVEKRFRDIEPRSMLCQGDILMNLVGASIGRTALYHLQDEANINQAVALIRLIESSENLSLKYLLHYFNSPPAVHFMLGSRVVTAQPNMSLTDVREFPIPLPPLAEQRRIVDKVDELMALCDRLEASLTTASEKRRRLLEAFKYR